MIPGAREDDLREARTLPDGAVIGCTTLEAVRAAKVSTARGKDALDVAEIDRMGYDAGRYARVAEAYAAMEVACVAHGGVISRRWRAPAPSCGAPARTLGPEAPGLRPDALHCSFAAAA